ncbi:pirin family protein [Mucilaginibacter terrae]|uniref:Redox-sensitive bicupin YhaK (Pirin superfamily) n=1 Tax=Mucilaginibacter terrae TaxID=1955052 RepID=A0ABU3GP10_9SPHI|nr:pirin family protein [Mucilaginibacter terrae]MDT3401335.1 redox-sensitive bicupin YhaK (pirin superfamily) [Mucilaginibacter terrae]
MPERSVSQIIGPRPTRGFLGEGHVAIPLLEGRGLEQTDPFILLMDDQLDLPGQVIVGGPHPHAGFEIITIVLEGQAGEGSRASSAGDLEWLTAGSGIVHTEEIKSRVKLRILQLWLQLPNGKIWMEPQWQKLSLQNVPVIKQGRSAVRVYSGTALGLTSPVINQVPTIILHVELAPHDEMPIEIPASYNGLIYMLEGSINAGRDRMTIAHSQVAWLDPVTGSADSKLVVSGGGSGGRFVLYAAEPQNAVIYSKGPFISDGPDDFQHLYHRYNTDKMLPLKDLPESRKFQR